MKINGGKRLTKYYCSLSYVLINTADLIICVTYTRRLKVFVWYLCLTASIIIIYSTQNLSYFSFLFPLLYMTKLEQKKFGSIVQILKQMKSDVVVRDLSSAASVSMGSFIFSRTSSAEQEYSFSKSKVRCTGKVKNDGAWSPDGWVTVTC